MTTTCVLRPDPLSSALSAFPPATPITNQPSSYQATLTPARQPIEIAIAGQLFRLPPSHQPYARSPGPRRARSSNRHSPSNKRPDHTRAQIPMASSPWDYIAKLVCIGDSGCGKSSLTIRLCEGRFSPHHDVTIGVEFGSRIVPVGPPHTRPSSFLSSPYTSPSPSAAAAAASTTTRTTTSSAPRADGLPEPPRDTSKTPQKHMKLSLWDTAGQETYKSVTRSYFRGASGALLVFDLSRKQTFRHVTDWLNDLRQIAEPDIVVVLVGNKADLAQQEDNKREVTRQEAEEWARRNGVLEYVETSAKSGENVEQAFMRVAERIFHNIQAGKYDLNDRRSGVKGPGAAGNRQVKLGADGKSAAGGGCC
ncbi:GTP-binding protein rab2 [Metarhizium album ARSEF 1941]|uniref:GTP-binding protein rab2 n=1 Tax=Metarhizium album (strain ARSEF 1941) TaxID=1081103 RepID=A0A0B2WVZ4_METAS|nr:GTP-binding protein rab2 [Metarhizium album ARSEF 1941]KHN98223.1 GTP-binding protein rab2 [Metarhizium album ARSEF 1941]